MNLEQISRSAVRVFFFGAFGLLVLAVLEVTAHKMGYTILRGVLPGRLLEYAVILLIFVVAILLRQIRDRLARA